MSKSKQSQSPPEGDASPKRLPEKRLASFVPYRGVLSLRVNGKSVTPLVRDVVPGVVWEDRPVSNAQDTNLYRLREVGLGWKAKGVFAYEALEERVLSLLRHDPNAVFWLEVAVDAPEWWRKAHPNELVGYCLPLKDKLPPVSWASARWQNEAGNALENLVKTVGKSAWREHCLGIQIAAGTDGEWRFPHAENLPDVGNALTDAFRTFALSKYRRNPGLLKIAWDNPRAEFDRITCPNAADRRLADYGVFRDPKRSRRTLDYYECLAMVQNDAALHFCRCVKRASEGQRLVGLSYSPLFGQEALPEDAHAFPQAVLESPDVDFFANVGTAGANSCLRAMNGSIALQQKFLFHVAVPDTPLERLSTLAKNYPMGMIVPNETPENTLRSLVPLFDRPSEKETVTQERIAVFVDPANLAVVASAESRLNELLLSAQLRELAHLDTPFDLYLVSDLFHAKLPKFKVALFLNVFYLSEAERRRIDGRIKQNNQIALWLFAPGLVNEEGISAEAALQVCGQKLRLERTTTSLKLRVVEVNDPITLGFHIATPMGADVPISPTLTITDKTSTRLGANSANKTAFAVRRYGHWTSVVFGTAPVPARLLQGVLRSLKPLAP